MNIEQKNILDKINSYRVISFDIFDTLVFRAVSKPEDVFKLVARKLNLVDDEYDFYSERLEAQKKAESEKSTEEMTLEDIYNKIKCPSSFSKNELMQEEIETELLVCKRNCFWDEIIESCVQSDKKIIITSDMYLPKVVIQKILRQCGITYHELFLSSDYGKRKSKGTLFKKIIEELHESPKDIIHIGDNFRSDFVMPRTAKIRSIWYKRNRKIDENSTLNSSVIGSLTANKVFDNEYRNLGYSVYGPLLVGFVTWIKKNIIDECCDSVYFFARDGYIVKKAYDILYPSDNSQYLFVSRRSLTVPRLASAFSMQDVISTIVNVKRHENIRELLFKIGVTDEVLAETLEKKYGEKIDRETLISQDGDEFYEAIKDEMISNASKENVTCKEYLAPKFKDKKVAVVDLGWYGTIQKSLVSLFKEWTINTEVLGLYLGKVYKHSDNGKLNAKGFIFDIQGNNNLYNQEFVFAYSGLIEVFFSAFHGTTIKYEKVNQEIKPILGYFEDTHLDAIKQMQEGAIKFVEDIKKYIVDYNLVFSPYESFNAANKMLTNPTSKEVKLFDKLSYFENENVKLIKCKGITYYLRHPRTALFDYAESYWKTGFIKQLLPFCDAGKIYLRLNRLKKSIK